MKMLQMIIIGIYTVNHVNNDSNQIGNNIHLGGFLIDLRSLYYIYNIYYLFTSYHNHPLTDQHETLSMFFVIKGDNSRK